MLRQIVLIRNVGFEFAEVLAERDVLLGRHVLVAEQEDGMMAERLVDAANRLGRCRLRQVDAVDLHADGG